MLRHPTPSSQGIGRACVEELAGLGCRVFTCCRTPADLESAISEWGALGFTVSGWACDLADGGARDAFVGKAAAWFAQLPSANPSATTSPRMDFLINNVGTNIRGKRSDEYTPGDYATIMTTNLASAFHLCQLSYPLLKASGTGASVVFLSSVAGIVAIRSGSVYAMSKAALNQLAKNLSCEWAADGIRVNSVAPWCGAVETWGSLRLGDRDSTRDEEYPAHSR